MSSEERLPLTALADGPDTTYRAADRSSGINYPFEESSAKTQESEGEH
jgi:hypothetical protein